MNTTETLLNAVKIIQLNRHSDERGFFTEIYNQNSIDALDISFRPVQDNCSRSTKKGTVRGLHFQKEPYAQAKLIRCTRGEIYDIAVDVRKGSPTFGKAAVVHLFEDDDKLVYIPKGFAHGVLIMRDQSEYNYKVDNVYNGQKENNGGLSIFYDRNELDIYGMLGNDDVILSEHDRNEVSPVLAELDTNFIFEE